MRLMTASLARCARSCRRKFQLQYLEGYRPVRDSEELAFGTLCHHALEAWWRAAQAQLPPETWLDAALAELGRHEATEIDLIRAQVMLTGYHLRWQDMRHGEHRIEEVLGVEVPFEGPFINPDTQAESRTWRLAGKLDVLVRLDDGRVVIVEHKTSGEDVSPGSDYWKRTRLDGQVSIYFEGGRLLGHQVDAVLYDVLAKPKHAPLSATPVEARKYTATGKLYAAQRDRDETPDEYRERLASKVAEEPGRWYARGEVVRLEAERVDAMRDVWQLAQALNGDIVAERFSRNPDACLAYGRPCPFWGVCTGEASLADPTAFRRLDNVHPELPAAPQSNPQHLEREEAAA